MATSSRSLWRSFVAWAAVTLLAVSAPQAPTARSQGETIRARILRARDGDSLVAQTDRGLVFEVRLYGIDCPEIRQPFGIIAKRFTEERLWDHVVDIAVVTKDQYDRLVGRIRIRGEDLSVALVSAGLAWHVAAYAPDSALASAEQSARSWRKGIWSQPDPQPPWEARRAAEASAGGRGAAGGRTRTQPAATADATGPFRGNVRSKVFHRPGCAYYTCGDCTAVFETREEALAAGYRPARCCKPAP